LAVEEGADEIAHMPSFGIITPELARMTAKRNVPVVTTMGQAGAPEEAIPPQMREAAAAMKVGTLNNLKILASNGVPVVIGADNPADTTANEAAYIRSLGIFDNAAMLRMWGTATPLAIFRNRKIGAFKAGDEASFIALGADPLTDWTATKKIHIRFKQGSLMTLSLP
jgi:imidazolonepropionase-like amidohydrolase